ncbi:MAG: UDP-N-acetylmuramoyl-tripeptide--D-alanyl-D-alanine ligase [Clostridia bacterium]|nr:UDP-N-acetylmuramoyl-tripeptide--D-alanyl-D-alanine ligase [Clostridia bacterium]
MKVKFSKGAIRADALAELFGGILRDGRGAEIPVGGICTDSREADQDTVFCALRGARTDGHEYIENALAAGCRCVLCEQSNAALETAGAAAIVVKDTELALARFANAYRQGLSYKSVAVTGSVGKTTAKEMIASVLETSFSTYKTAGNHNSVIGMPMSLLEIPSDTQWAVLEMGMSGFGEIERLSIVAEPNVAVITNIGTAHIEMLGSRENICRAKLEVLCGLQEGGTLILNGDEPLLKKIGGKSYKTLYVSLERENSDFFANNIRVENGYTLFDITWKHGKECDLRINVMGRHNVYAASFAFAVGILSGMEPDDIRLGLSRFSSAGLRQHIEPIGEWTVIADCYNASPESMIASLEVLRELSRKTGGRSVAVLGDMLELGAQSCAMHQRVGTKVASLGIDLLITLGERGRRIAVGAQRMGMQAVYSLDAPSESNRRQIAEQLRGWLKSGDVVLFKASRGIKAEQIIEELKE